MRIQVSFKDETIEEIKNLAKRKGMRTATYDAELAKKGLESEEDRYFVGLGEKILSEEAKNPNWISHKEAWK